MTAITSNTGTSILSVVEKLSLQQNELIQVLGEPVEEKKKWDRRELRDGDWYWYICDLGVVNSKPYINSQMDIWNIESGNCFETEEEAEAYKQKTN